MVLVVSPLAFCEPEAEARQGKHYGNFYGSHRGYSGHHASYKRGPSKTYSYKAAATHPRCKTVYETTYTQECKHEPEQVCETVTEPVCNTVTETSTRTE